jgi:hypothetical protein
MNTDTILQSFLRGRMLAATAATTIASTGTAAVLTGQINEWLLVLNTLLAFVSAIAAIVSKLREIKNGR